MTDQEARDWARRCWEVTRQRMPESEVWEAIAERGHAWLPRLTKGGKLYRGGHRMTVGYCFYNAAHSVHGRSKDAPSWKYAEGFALSALGLWNHHAWVVLPDGTVMDRTWDEPGQLYVGVVVDPTPFEEGESQLTALPVGIPWAPGFADDELDKLAWIFGPRDDEEVTTR